MVNVTTLCAGSQVFRKLEFFWVLHCYYRIVLDIFLRMRGLLHFLKTYVRAEGSLRNLLQSGKPGFKIGIGN